MKKWLFVLLVSFAMLAGAAEGAIYYSNDEEPGNGGNGEVIPNSISLQALPDFVDMQEDIKQIKITLLSLALVLVCFIIITVTRVFYQGNIIFSDRRPK